MDWACSLWQNKKWFWRLTRAFNAPDTDFHNGSGAATKWRETTWNTSFRRKVCGVNQTDVLEHRNGVQIPKMWVLDLKECIEFFQAVCLESYYSKHSIKYTPILVSAMGRVRRRNGVKPSKTWVLDWKKWNGRVWCKKTRNVSRGINSCIKCTSIPVFASIKECLELLVNFMNKILIHKTFKALYVNYLH